MLDCAGGLRMSKVTREIGNIFSLSLRKFFRLKTAVLMILLLFIVHMFLTPLKQFSTQVDVKVSPWVFPFLISEDYFSFIFLCGAAYFFSDVPFMQYGEMYRIVRTGRKRWAMEQIGAIVLNSFQFVVSGIVLSMVVLIPQVSVEMDWGRVLHTIAITDAGDMGQFLFAVPYEILVRYSVIELILITITVGGLVVSFVGLLMFAVGLLFSRIYAICAAMVIFSMPFLVMSASYLVQRNLAYISPAFWIRITQIGSEHFGIYFPDLQYVVVILLLLCLSLVLLIVWRVRNVDFQWNHEE